MSSPKNSELFLLLLLGVLSTFGPLVMDLCLPSLPQLVDFFATSTSMTQLTLTTAMLGLAVGQLFLMGLVLPAISSFAMNSERQNAGSASVLLGFAPFFLGGGGGVALGGDWRYFCGNCGSNECVRCWRWACIGDKR